MSKKYPSEINKLSNKKIERHIEIKNDMYYKKKV